MRALVNELRELVEETTPAPSAAVKLLARAVQKRDLAEVKKLAEALLYDSAYDSAEDRRRAMDPEGQRLHGPPPPKKGKGKKTSSAAPPPRAVPEAYTPEKLVATTLPSLNEQVVENLDKAKWLGDWMEAWLNKVLEKNLYSETVGVNRLYVALSREKPVTLELHVTMVGDTQDANTEVPEETNNNKIDKIFKSRGIIPGWMTHWSIEYLGEKDTYFEGYYTIYEGRYDIALPTLALEVLGQAELERLAAEAIAKAEKNAD